MGLNFQDVIRDVHDPDRHALQVNAGNSTIYAVVNTGASVAGNTTLNPGPNQIGSVTVSHPVSIAGNITLNDPKTYIGLVTSTVASLPTVFLGTPTLFAVVNTGVSASGNVTLDPGSKTGVVGNVTLTDAKTYVGLTTTTLGIGTQYIGSVTVANTVPVSFSGNVTLSDAKTYVGLTTTTLGIGTQYVGLASVNIGGTLPALTASAANIGSVSVLGGGIGLNAGINGIGFATINVAAIAAGANYVGLASINGSVVNLAGTNNIGSVSILGGGIGLNAGVNFIGLATVSNGLAWADPKTFVGLVTASNGLAWTDPKAFIGLVSVSNAASYNYISTVSITVVKNGPGRLDKFNINAVSLPSTIIYDNNAASGNIIASFGPGVPVGSWRYGIACASGITVKTAIGVAPSLTVVYS